MAEASATAEGELARTPLAHLLVHALDRRLTGALFLAPPEGEEHVVRLNRGVPVKVRPGDRFALLGELLIEAGAIDAGTLEAALATKGLLGDVLLLAGRVERDVLEKVAEDQFRRRMVRLFALPPETGYRYYEGHEELAEYGGDPACLDPLALIWAGLRIHGDASTMMEGTLARLGDAPLRLHPAATVARFGLDAEEAKLLEGITPGPVTLEDLCWASSPELTRRFVYALAMTRQLDAGTGLPPLGAEAPAASLRSAPGTAVARMALRSTVHRVGAAAPDAPGDGERRAPPVASRRARERVATEGAPEDTTGGRASAPPVSDVAPVFAGDPQASTANAPLGTEGPESGVVAVEAPGRAPEAATDQGAPAAPSGVPPVDRARGAEVTTSPSGIALPIQALRASAPDLEVKEAEEEIDEHSGEREREEEGPAEEAPAVSEAFAGMSPAELFWLASECLAERDLAGALEACGAGRKKAPEDPDLAALEAWVRALIGGADVEELALQLDDVLDVHQEHVEARYYRGMLRKRLGDEAGCRRDMQRVVELSPDHEGACLELSDSEEREGAKERTSLFGKLFKR
jgi:hypothetical protein